jgi:predicted DsbA family dithiol-disulfide isomerase
MHRSNKPLEIVVYQDVLCAWCYVATARLDHVRRELGPAVQWTFRPYALRLKDALPTGRELHTLVTGVERARAEPEGDRLQKDLWLAQDLPRSSIPALVALEAARLQGEDARERLCRAMQRAALELGLNVTRSDVALELASAEGLDLNRFTTALRSPQARRLVLKEHHLAAGRGVKGVPTLVIGGQWMLSGLREVREYKDHILSCMNKRDRGGTCAGGERVLH